MKFPISAVMALSTLVVAGIAGAETPAMSPMNAPAMKTVDPRLNDATVVCKAEDQTGTRLGAHKTCHTRREWADIAAESRQRVDRAQQRVGPQ